MKIRSLFVAGTFDDYGGKSSKIAKQIFESAEPPNADYYNGGFFKEISDIIEEIEKYKLIYWFANVPNDKPKLVREIKRRNKTCILVTSKRNVEKGIHSKTLYIMS
jgi:hypothetical protein